MLTEVVKSDSFEHWRVKTNTIAADMGDISLLETANNANVVGAVNELNDHANNTDNPHGVTAAQAGAMSTSHAANTITGLGTSGTSTVISRDDHAHTDVYQPNDPNMITWPSSISATEVEYLNGVSSNIQDQITRITPTINNQTGTTYTLVLNDKIVTCSNADPITVTIPNNSSVAYEIGTIIKIIQLGIGQVSVEASSGVTLNSSSSLDLTTQYSVAELIKIASNTWILHGDLV